MTLPSKSHSLASHHLRLQLAAVVLLELIEPIELRLVLQLALVV